MTVENRDNSHPQFIITYLIKGFVISKPGQKTTGQIITVFQ